MRNKINLVTTATRKSLIVALIVLVITFWQLRVSRQLPHYFLNSNIVYGGDGNHLSFNTTSEPLVNPYVTTIEKNNSIQNVDADDPHSHFHLEFPLCLVHVGKAAGSSVSCSLGLMYANCEGMPRDAIGDDVKHYHLKRNDCPPSTKSYLVTLRDPIDRLNSWFWFEREQTPTRSDGRLQAKLIKMRNFLFVDCFSTFESLVLALQEPLNVSSIPAIPKNMTCPQRAWAAVLGARAFSYHEWYNYEHYWIGLHSRKSDSAAIYALRTEHLQEDWESISTEPMHKKVNKRPENNDTKALAVDHSLSSEAIKILCRALCDEFQYYKRFLQAAVNLNTDQKSDTLKELSAKCPEEPEHIHECTDLPAFPPLPVNPGQYKQETKQRFFIVREN
jgi:hypothetical protein